MQRLDFKTKCTYIEIDICTVCLAYNPGKNVLSWEKGMTCVG